MKILTLSGSLRSASFNTTLCRSVADLAPDGVEVEHFDLRPIPLYDGDLDERPAAVTALIQAVERADGVFIATPEYNYAISGVLKNALDWASRPGYDSCFKHKPVAMATASPSAVGGARAQQNLRSVLGAMLAHVHPYPEFCVTSAHTKLEGGQVTDEPTRRALQKMVAAFVAYGRAL